MAEEFQLPDDWTEHEIWAWKRIRAGEVADFNAKAKRAAPLEPRSDDDWTCERRISARFLRTILTDPSFVDATPFSGVRIFGALIDDAVIDLEHARLPRLLWLENSRITTALHARNLRVDGEFSLRASFVAGDVQLIAARIAESLTLAQGRFEGPVILNRAKVSGSAFLRWGAAFKGMVDLGAAEIGSNLEMGVSTFEGPVRLNRAKVSGYALLNGGSTFRDEVNLGGAEIGTHLEMDGATFEGRVNLNSAKVSGNAFLSRSATFEGEVDLCGVKIGSSLEMEGATFEGPVIMSSAKVSGGAFLGGGATFKGEVDLIGAEIGSDLDLSNAEFGAMVMLTNARIGSELRLGSKVHKPARWPGGTLILRNCRCTSLQDRWPTKAYPQDDSWPASIELEGFFYDQLGGLRGSGDGPWNMRARPAWAYRAWLERDASYSPQPYKQLANVLRQSGEPAKANDILYAARERQRSELWDGTLRGTLGWIGMSLLQWTIGYGLGQRYFRVLVPITALTLLGAVLLHQFGAQEERGWPQLLFASFDQLLPLVTLDRAHEGLFSDASVAAPHSLQPASLPGNPTGGENEQEGLTQPPWLICYFYVHKLFGWLLGLFLAAGLAGLTQRN